MIRKAIKGSVIVVHLVYDTIDNYEPLNFDFIDKDIMIIKKNDEENEQWIIYFDGAMNVLENGVAVVIIYSNIQETIPHLY